MADTIIKRFLETANRHPAKTAVRFTQNRSARNPSWLELNWTDYRKLVESLAAGLQATGIRKGDRVAVLASTRLEWAALDLAIMGLGAITIPIYPSSTTEDISFILHDSQAKLLFVEDLDVFKKMHAILSRDSKLRRPEKVVLIETARAEDIPSFTEASTLDDLQVLGGKALKTSPTIFELAAEEVHADDVATIIYTSGTTGRPKGVVITHTQIFSEVSEAFPLLGVTSSDITLTFLPFAHVLGRIEIWGHALIGYTMGFAVSIENLKNDFKEVRPTLLIAVPRIFEKIHSGIMAQADISPLRRKVFDWALDLGKQLSRCKQEKRAIPLDLAIQYAAARKLVFDSIQERLGGRLRFAVCGGAPLNPEIAEFFHASGLLILEGYGLTETTAAVCVNTPFDYRFGSVGKPIGDVKVKIAEDGEVLIKSRKVMREYFGDPESTKFALQDGWLHTGDIGQLDDQGRLSITDRKKDLIKTAGGKYVAPQRLEGLVKLSHYVSNVHIHGDNRKYCVALITMAWDSISLWAKEQGLPLRNTAEASENPRVKDLIRRAVAEANANLASFETIKQFRILPDDFSVENGELTPSLKIKRKVVDEKYKAAIDSMY